MNSGNSQRMEEGRCVYKNENNRGLHILNFKDVRIWQNNQDSKILSIFIELILLDKLLYKMFKINYSINSM